MLHCSVVNRQEACFWIGGGGVHVWMPSLKITAYNKKKMSVCVVMRNLGIYALISAVQL